MRGYYLSQMEVNNAGPIKKISGQVKAFNDAGLCTKLFNEIVPNSTVIKKISRRLPLTSICGNFFYRDTFSDADFFYIRFRCADYPFISFLKELRKKRPYTKIIIEFADYPYDSWMKSFTNFPIYLKELNARRKYKKLVDRFAVLCDIPEIYGVSTIRFTNGILVDQIKRREANETTSSINIIAVAGMCLFHGYDRFIEGLYNYYKFGGKRKIIFHLVGEKPGDQIPFYKKLISEHHLENRVILHGDLRGENLDSIYNECLLGVGSLGMHRLGYNLASSLKTREYLAKGLPIITGCDVDILNENKDVFPYFLQFPSDESPIDIEKVIEFHDKIYFESGKTQEEIIDEIRNFAYRTCDMSVAMKPIIDYIKSGEK